MEPIASYPMRWMARANEVALCAGYVVSNGKLPPLSKMCHAKYIPALDKP